MKKLLGIAQLIFAAFIFFAGCFFSLLVTAEIVMLFVNGASTAIMSDINSSLSLLSAYALPTFMTLTGLYFIVASLATFKKEPKAVAEPEAEAVVEEAAETEAE